MWIAIVSNDLRLDGCRGTVQMYHQWSNFHRNIGLVGTSWATEPNPRYCRQLRHTISFINISNSTLKLVRLFASTAPIGRLFQNHTPLVVKYLPLISSLNVFMPVSQTHFWTRAAHSAMTHPCNTACCDSSLTFATEANHWAGPGSEDPQEQVFHWQSHKHPFRPLHSVPKQSSGKLSPEA